jgi:VanZ family protein
MEVSTLRRVRLCAAAILLNLLFIWGNSLMPGHISAGISRFAANVLSVFFPGEGAGEVTPGEGVLRKIAHILEFCSLGILLCCLLTLLKKSYFLSLPLGASVGAIDECLQLLVPDRGPHIRDVGIDTLGVIAGIGVFTIALAIRKHKKSINNLEETKL